MITVLAIAHAALFVILVSNFAYLRRVARSSPPDNWPALTICIPARNEEENLQRLLPSLLSQDYPDFRIIVYDDGSTDRTWEVINSFGADKRLTALRGDGPPPGWVGKVHGLYQATRTATGDFFLFVDADGEFLVPSALRTLVQTLMAQPRESALTALTRLRGGGLLLVSFVPFAILTSLPWSLVRRGPHRLGALNGQLWMIRAEDYRRLEPHKQHADAILEDVEIGRFLSAHGIAPVLFDAQKLFSVHMYGSFAEAWHGFKKNAYLIMGGSPLAFIGTMIPYLAVFILAPFYSLWFLLSLYLLKFATDLRTGFGPAVTLATPVGLVCTVLIQADSAIAHWQQRVTWKGRLVGSKPDNSPDANSGK